MLPDVSRLQRRAQAVVFTVCLGNNSAWDLTLPRWERFAQWHGYDWLVVRRRHASISGVATVAWERIFVALPLLFSGRATDPEAASTKPNFDAQTWR